MGAQTFVTTVKGSSAREAFGRAVDEAQYESGHGGYTGTIAEKSTFVMISPPPGDRRSVLDFARKMLDDGDPRIDDKWGPAGCMPLGDGEYVFFGWASS